MYTLLHISDTHCGLRSGLIAPGVELEYDNGERKTIKEEDLSSLSAWVLEQYERVITTTIEYAGDDTVIVYHTGEICHGATFPDYLYSAWQEHQETIAFHTLSLLRRIPTLAALHFAYGSAAHDWGQSSATRNVASRVAAWGYHTECVTHGLDDVDGCQIDYAHRGPVRSKGEDIALAGRRYVLRSSRQLLERGQRAPDIILRGHVHERLTEPVFVPWGRSGLLVLLSIAPPLTGPNEYARGYTRNAPLSEVGGTLIRIDNGRVVDWQAVTRERDNRVHSSGTDFYHWRGSVNKQ